jgi:hypothetical protein
MSPDYIKRVAQRKSLLILSSIDPEKRRDKSAEKKVTLLSDPKPLSKGTDRKPVVKPLAKAMAFPPPEEPGFEVTPLVEQLTDRRAKELGIECTDDEALLALVPLLERQGLIDFRLDSKSLFDKKNANIDSWLNQQGWKWEQLIERGRNMVLYAKVTTVNVPLSDDAQRSFFEDNQKFLNIPARVRLKPAASNPKVDGVPFYRQLLEPHPMDQLGLKSKPGDKIEPYIEVDRLRGEVVDQLVGKKPGETIVVWLNDQPCLFTIEKYVPAYDLSTDERLSGWFTLSAKLQSIGVENKADQLLPNDAFESRGFLQDVVKNIRPSLRSIFNEDLSKGLQAALNFVNTNPLVRFAINIGRLKLPLVGDVTKFQEMIDDIDKRLKVEQKRVESGKLVGAELERVNQTIRGLTSRKNEFEKFKKENEAWLVLRKLMEPIDTLKSEVDKAKKVVKTSSDKKVIDEQRKIISAKEAEIRKKLDDPVFKQNLAKTRTDIAALMLIFNKNNNFTLPSVDAGAIFRPRLNDIVFTILGNLTGFKWRGDGSFAEEFIFPHLPVTRY